MKFLLNKKLIKKPKQSKFSLYYLSNNLDDIESRIGFYDADLNTSISNFLESADYFYKKDKIELASKEIEITYGKLYAFTTLVFQWANENKNFIEYISKRIFKIFARHKNTIENYLKNNRRLSDFFQESLLKDLAETQKQKIDFYISELKKYENSDCFQNSDIKNELNELNNILQNVKAKTNSSNLKFLNEGKRAILRELYLK